MDKILKQQQQTREYRKYNQEFSKVSIENNKNKSFKMQQP